MSEELTQGTDAWRLARAGSLGASSIHEALARTKAGWGASRANVLARLLIERITGQPQEGFQSQAMLDGIAREPEARAAYQFEYGVLVTKVGLFKHPAISGSHASPDGAVSSDGLIEIKCPTSATHLESLLGAPIPQKYVYQMQWQLCCAGRQWCDFASYHPAFPDNMKIHVTRVPRDGAVIAELEAAVREFLSELDAKLAALTSRYDFKREAA